MGCSESKSSVATWNTITQSKKPSVVGAAHVDEPKKVESVEKTVEPLENKASEGAADIKEVNQDAEVASEVEKKDNVAKEDEKEKPEKADENVKEEKAIEEKEPEKQNGDKEVATNEEVSIKEEEPAPATSSHMVAETAGAIVGAIVFEESNPPEKKE